MTELCGFERRLITLRGGRDCTCPSRMPTGPGRRNSLGPRRFSSASSACPELQDVGPKSICPASTPSIAASSSRSETPCERIVFTASAVRALRAPAYLEIVRNQIKPRALRRAMAGEKDQHRVFGLRLLQFGQAWRRASGQRRLCVRQSFERCQNVRLRRVFIQQWNNLDAFVFLQL